MKDNSAAVRLAWSGTRYVDVAALLLPFNASVITSSRTGADDES